MNISLNFPQKILFCLAGDRDGLQAWVGFSVLISQMGTESYIDINSVPSLLDFFFLFFITLNFQVYFFSIAYYFASLIKIFAFTLIFVTVCVSEVSGFNIQYNFSFHSGESNMHVWSHKMSVFEHAASVTAGKAGGALYFERNKAEETL